MAHNFAIDQIVKGKYAGVFMILGFRNIYEEQHAQLKEVNPNDHTQTAPGEICLPVDCILPLNA